MVPYIMLLRERVFPSNWHSDITLFPHRNMQSGAFFRTVIAVPVLITGLPYKAMVLLVSLLPMLCDICILNYILFIALLLLLNTDKREIFVAIFVVVMWQRKNYCMSLNTLCFY